MLSQQLIARLPPKYPVDPRNRPVALAVLSELERAGKLLPTCVVDGDEEGSIYCIWPGWHIACVFNQGYTTVERVWDSDERADEHWDFSPLATAATCEKVCELLRTQ